MEVVDAYKNGESIRSITSRLRVGTQRVNQFLRDQGVIRNASESHKMAWVTRPARARAFTPRQGKDIPEDVVLQMYSEGKTQSQIGSLLGIGARRIKAFLIEQGMLVERIEFLCLGCGAMLDGHRNTKVCLVCAPDTRSANVFWRYGITKPQFDQMIIDQGGHCALCPRDAIRVDHNHETGVVRGIVCNGCNMALSRVDENPNWAADAIEYALKERTWSFVAKPLKREM